MPHETGGLAAHKLQTGVFVRHCVLIIDDDASTRLFLARALQAEGYDTITAENGAHGLRRLVERKPCVILLDFDMPVMDGHDFRDLQKRVAPDVPIICITGATETEHIPQRVGASVAFSKPIDIRQLCSTVAELCGRDHAHGEPEPTATSKQRSYFPD